MNLWRVRIDELSGRPLGDPEPITTPATSLAHISVSGDGRRVAYSSVLVTTNIQRVAFDPVAGTVVGEPEWVTTGSRRWSSPDPSPDGRTVAFYSLVQPEGHVYVVGADGTGLRQVTGRDSSIDRVPRWSPDGQWIALFSAHPSPAPPAATRGPLQVWKIRPDGSDRTEVTAAPSNVAVVAWSPDGSRMAVSSVARPGAVYVFDPNRPWGEQARQTLTPPPSALAPFVVNSWSPDGRRLAGGVEYKDAGVVIYTFGADRYERLTDFGEWPVWLPDSRRLLFVSGGDGFFVVDRVTNQVRKVLSSGRDVIGPPRLARDGRLMVYSRRVTEADIWLLTLP